MPNPDHLILHELIPDPDNVRRRLAVATTEADLLPLAVRVSQRLARERERPAPARGEDARHAS